MSGRPLRAALAEFLAVRRSLGFKLARDGLLLEQTCLALVHCIVEVDSASRAPRVGHHSDLGAGRDLAPFCGQPGR